MNVTDPLGRSQPQLSDQECQVERHVRQLLPFSCGGAEFLGRSSAIASFSGVSDPSFLIDLITIMSAEKDNWPQGRATYSTRMNGIHGEARTRPVLLVFVSPRRCETRAHNMPRNSPDRLIAGR